MTSALVLEGPQLEGLELVLTGTIPDGRRYRLPSSVGTALWPQLCVREGSGPSIERGERVELCDPDNTPLAILHIDDHTRSNDGMVWVAGEVEPLRSPEHGPARDVRLTPRLDLSGGVVAVFSPNPSPADVVRAVDQAGERRLDLVAEGVADRAASTRLVQELQDAALVRPNTRVHFLPAVDIGPQTVDVTTEILAARGAQGILDFRRPYRDHGRGAVVLFTGLSGAGKSTVARALTEHLAAHTSRRCVLLDGDHVRRELAGDLGFSAEDRDRNLKRQAWVGARVAEAGGIAVCAPIAPFAASRAAMRAKVEPESRFILIHVSTPIAVAEERDRKGLYAKARAGLITDFTGIDSPYEVPEDADLALDTSVLTVEMCVEQVMELLAREGLVDDAHA